MRPQPCMKVIAIALRTLERDHRYCARTIGGAGQFGDIVVPMTDGERFCGTSGRKRQSYRSGSTGAATSGGSSSAQGTKTATGSSVDTRWGPVQVKVTTTNGKITDVTVLDAPANNSRDVEINDYALPILKQETLSAQSANIDSVSGATYTSEGYIGSLQSALDQLGK